jgi:Ser-tRNA(Ala) deacylase AlaX
MAVSAFRGTLRESLAKAEDLKRENNELKEENKMPDLKDVLSEISLDDISVAPDGKVHIANPAVASRISALKSPVSRGEASNGSDCTNGSQCLSRHLA